MKNAVLDSFTGIEKRDRGHGLLLMLLFQMLPASHAWLKCRVWLVAAHKTPQSNSTGQLKQRLGNSSCYSGFRLMDHIEMIRRILRLQTILWSTCNTEGRILSTFYEFHGLVKCVGHFRSKRPPKTISTSILHTNGISYEGKERNYMTVLTI